MATRNELIIETARDQRALDWLVRQAGWDRIDEVLAALPGKRKPYVSNIAKALHMVVPDSVLVTPAEQARPELKKILDYLKQR
jgi:hypothetical protein